jgi:hypothetical protein
MTKQKTVFNCSCRGCRGHLPRVAQIWHVSQLATHTEGHFFSPSAMKYFNSRLGNWDRLANPNGDPDRDGVAVIVSSKYDYEGAARHYELVTVCGWGNITRQQGPEGLEKYATSKEANKALKAATYPVGCECHGCILDREGR